MKGAIAGRGLRLALAGVALAALLLAQGDAFGQPGPPPGDQAAPSPVAPTRLERLLEVFTPRDLALSGACAYMDAEGNITIDPECDDPPVSVFSPAEEGAPPEDSTSPGPQ